MKIEGVVGKLATKRVVLPRHDGAPIVLTVQALPIGYTATVTSLIPNLIPKCIGVEVDPGTGQTLREPDGSPVKKWDTTDARHAKRQQTLNLYQNTLMVATGLQADPTVTFDAVMEKGKAEDYAKAIQGEMKAFGLSGGDFAILLTEVLRVSNLDDESVDKDQDSFFSQERAKAESSQQAAP